MQTSICGICAERNAFALFYFPERQGTDMKLEGQVRIPSGCAIAAVISREGNRMSGGTIANAMKPMHDRSNGLGGGFAGYGIYPEYKELYAFHLFFDQRATRKSCEAFLKEQFEIVKSERIPTRKIPAITDEPVIWRYFAAPLKSVLADLQLDKKEFVARTVMKINTGIKGAYVFSSGKNMGTFKAVGYPEDVGAFYRLEEYEGYSWTAHGRYPTNTPGWWGGAHPFTLLDWSVVHNGEISSYDANRRFIEMFGYQCTLQTDTEVITYVMDYLIRVQGLTLEEAAGVIAAPFWDLSFPALLKVYIENLCVEGITFKTGERGLEGLCKADHMVYLTTRGGCYAGTPLEMGSRYMAAMAEFFGIGRYDCIAAEGLDIGLVPVEELLGAAKKEAEEVVKTF